MEKFSENLDQDTLNLFEWMKTKDFDISINTHLKMVVSDNILEGRCCISTEKFNPNSTLAEIPSCFLINYRTALNNKDLLKFFEWSSNQTSVYNLTRLDALYLLLILEKSTPSSDLFVFIKTMPLSYDTPEYFCSELIDIYPDYIKEDMITRVKNLESKFQNIKNLLNKFLSENNSNESIKILIDNFSKDIFKWAFCSVNSRCFHIKEEELCDENEIEQINKLFGHLISTDLIDDIDYDEKFKREEEMRNSSCCLIPFIDFLNHSFESNAYAFYDNERKTYVLKSQFIDETEQCAENEQVENLFDVSTNDNVSTKQYDINSPQLVKENSQVYITYGFHDNKTLLIEYGFIIEDNIYDKIVFKKNDFEIFLKNKANLSFLWKKAGEHNLLEDLSCNKTGPAWFLTKLIDLIIDMNILHDSNIKDESYSSYEIKHLSEIRLIYLQLMNEYQKKLTDSIENISKLNNQNDDPNFICHKNFSLKLLKLHLEIVICNLELANDKKKWMKLF
jgi:hypothetical protein